MTVGRRHRLEAEVASLKALISVIPASDVVGRSTLGYRLADAESELDSVLASPRTRAQVALAFDGPVVEGQLGIETEFSARALGAFQDAVSTLYAARLHGSEVGARGPVPGKKESRLHVTGVLHGSFGFILEELDPDGDQWTESSLRKATDIALEYIAGLTSSEADDADAVIGEINKRTLQNMSELLSVIHNGRSSLTVYKETEAFQLDTHAVERGYFRLKDAEIEEQELSLRGVLRGVLPQAKRFEFAVTGGEILRGAVSREMVEKYEYGLSTTPLTGRNVKGVFIRKVVRRPGQEPRTIHTLLDIEGAPRPPQILSGS
jgi:hypothetical protein